MLWWWWSYEFMGTMVVIVVGYVVVIIKAIGHGSNQINKRGIKHTLERM